MPKPAPTTHTSTVVEPVDAMLSVFSVLPSGAAHPEVPVSPAAATAPVTCKNRRREISEDVMGACMWWECALRCVTQLTAFADAFEDVATKEHA